MKWMLNSFSSLIIWWHCVRGSMAFTRAWASKTMEFNNFSPRMGCSRPLNNALWDTCWVCNWLHATRWMSGGSWHLKKHVEMPVARRSMWWGLVPVDSRLFIFWWQQTHKEALLGTLTWQSSTAQHLGKPTRKHYFVLLTQCQLNLMEMEMEMEMSNCIEIQFMMKALKMRRYTCSVKG